MDALFSLPWHQIGRHGRKLTQNVGSHADEERWQQGGEKEVEMQVESVREK
jgi:hypothetical protein